MRTLRRMCMRSLVHVVSQATPPIPRIGGGGGGGGGLRDYNHVMLDSKFFVGEVGCRMMLLVYAPN